ncbi:hypothetical protein CHLRE_10g458150v5 [Chlamydomonas reinhardtii]|uniref:Uncharacterized protein n=1 Tax=Chlamydomonas reinhardtii TaxID=3055 RepID=A0A2K3DBN5_CHLRE|nr:uncharacterized protein CHLRE_10g458150v5 [Chlamydomonas reinhardtii]PNW77947.1 hypothetical protein CHLRE_10g458150v5 [Chlamydomonas reinhardtii]
MMRPTSCGCMKAGVHLIEAAGVQAGSHLRKERCHAGLQLAKLIAHYNGVDCSTGAIGSSSSSTSASPATSCPAASRRSSWARASTSACSSASGICCGVGRVPPVTWVFTIRACCARGNRRTSRCRRSYPRLGTAAPAPSRPCTRATDPRASHASKVSSEDQVPGGGGGGGVEPCPLPASPQLRRFLQPACQSFDGTSADAVESPAQPAHHPPAAFPPHAAASSAASSGGGSFRRARMTTAVAATAAVATTADGHASAAHAPGIGSGSAADAAAANSPLQRSQYLQHARYTMTRPAALSLPHIQQVAASDAASTAGLLLPTPPPMLQSPSAGGPRGLAASGATAMPACSSPKARQQGAMRSGGWCGGGAGGGGTGSPGPGGGDDMATPSSSSGYGGGASVPETAAGAAVVAPSPRGYGGIIFLYDGINGDGPQGSSGADARRGDEWQQSGSLPFFAAAPVTSRSPRASYSGGGGGGAAGSSRFGGGATGTSSEKSIRLPASVLTASTSTGGIAGNSSGASCVVGEDLARGLISGSSGRQLLPSSGVGALTGSPTRTRLARTEQRRSRQAVAAVSSLAPTGAGALPSNSYESASAPLLLPTVLGPLSPTSPKLPASVTGMSSSSSIMAAGALAGAESAVTSALQPELQTRLCQRPGGSLCWGNQRGGPWQRRGGRGVRGVLEWMSVEVREP